jgi:hypothetical protein
LCSIPAEGEAVECNDYQLFVNIKLYISITAIKGFSDRPIQLH